ncbi:MAG: PLP-dependent aminotransferase family protein [Clostridium argentinense]|uniref:MocR-like pyridoxine biosynthesis transcription factor PdxR n=1 Tax=Clostridium butanoliproducens TaxID=2991837 RepID=UPI001D712D14|nr:PLP-dependent aminotransferase family protein [Clostridium butanoliproducens]MBS5822343.1 PLP-dependent aminotransferase family protein [Clostridium argentinense]
MIFSSFKIESGLPIYIQIEEHIKDSISKALLQKGSKLPSTREVSEMLNISRNSVVTAYENLESEGIVETLKGKGTFVAIETKVMSGEFNVDWKDKINSYGTVCRELDIIKTELPWKKGMISFKSIAPEEHLFDLEEFKRAFLNGFSLEGDKLLNYGYAKGYKPLIEYLMDYMEEKGVNTKGKEVLITNGFTEGFDIVLSSLTIPGDSIVCENPTHNTALKIMKAHGLKVVGIPMDLDGIDTKRLEEILQNNSIKLSYIIPSYHNPTGVVMSGEKRQEVFRIFQKYKVPIIEDGFNEELLYSSSHIPSIASLCTKGNGIIYIGSFSKVLFPGLRLGWIFGDTNLIDTLESVKRARTIHSSFIDQGAFYHYMKSGAFNRYIKKIRKYYGDKYEYTLEQVKKYIPNESIMGQGGLHIFIKLHNNINSRIVLERCYKKGVVFTPGDIFYTDDSGKSTMRLGFSRVSEEDIEKGVKIIGSVVKELSEEINI